MPCKPDSDSNIFASENPSSPRYFGLGPGQAYEEMQFYPPGWVPWPAGIGCTATQWCAALNIDTFSENQNTGQFDNTACLNTVGPEPVNFAFVTKSGKSTAPANPGAPQHFIPNNKANLLMNSGDQLTVHLFDTPDGLKVTIADHTTGATGSMTASKANGFGTVLFQPNATQVHDQAVDLPRGVQHLHAADPQRERGAHLQHRVLRRDRPLGGVRPGQHQEPDRGLRGAARPGHQQP